MEPLDSSFEPRNGASELLFARSLNLPLLSRNEILDVLEGWDIEGCREVGELES